MKSYLFATVKPPQKCKWVDAADEAQARTLFEARMRIDGVDMSAGSVCLDRADSVATVHGHYNTRTDGTGRLVAFSVTYEPSSGRKITATIDGEMVHPSAVPEHEFRIATTYGKKE